MKEQIKNTIAITTDVAKTLTNALATAKKDRIEAKSFVNGTKMSLHDFSEFSRKVLMRHPFKSSGLIGFKCEWKTSKGLLFNLDIYDVNIITDPNANCTWMWVTYNHMIDIDFAGILGSKFVDGYVYRLPYVPNEGLKNGASNNEVIKTRFERIRKNVKKKWKEDIDKVLKEIPMPEV